MTIVSVYDLNDELIYSGSYKEVAKLFNTSVKCLHCMVSRYLRGERKYSRLNGMKVTFYKTKMDMKEIREYD